MTPRSRAQDIVEHSLLEAKPICDVERQEAAARALSYLESASFQEQDLTDSWLTQYHPDAQEFWKEQPKSVFNIFAAVVRKLATLYGNPVQRTWPEGSERWEKAWAKIEGFDALMQDVDEATTAAGTMCVRPLVLEPGAAATFALYTADQIEYSQNPLDKTLADQLVFAWENGAGDSITTTRHFWTAEEFMETVDDQLVTREEHPYGMIPVVTFRNKTPRKRFFDEPATDLVLAALALNRGITDLTYALPAHCSPTAVLRGADKTTPLKLGLRSRVDIDQQWGGMEFVGPAAPISQVIEALQFLLSLFLSSRGIPEDTFMVKQQGQSGVAIVAKETSLIEYRERRINQFRPLEQLLMRLTVMVQEIHDGRPCTLDQVPVPIVTYQKPKQPMSADERQEWMDAIRMHTATAIDMMMAEDPSLTKDEAVRIWKENRKFNVAAQAAPVFDRGAGGRAGRGAGDDEDDDQDEDEDGAQ